MRENYNSETVEALYADHFASWNILADSFHSFLDPADGGLELFPRE